MRRQSKYDASLQAAPGLTDEERKAAEEKFLELLERVFGSASKVRGAYCECVAVRSLRVENPWSTTTPEEVQAVTLWEKAAEKATRLVFSQMKIPPGDAFFELHVWNSRTN
ncbi:MULTISPECIES: hypothetical protein [Polaromonas]|uniref:Uncharacterized protein n=1 Tax=Polaromonas aquatica TaxID=332657 RepID=A0ABW1TQP1_9BURK